MAFWKKEEKKEIPSFPKAPNWYLYSEWEREVDKIYHGQRISDEKLIRMVIFKFEGCVLTWWNKMERLWRKERGPKVDTWQRMKYVLRERCEPFSREWQIYDVVFKKEKERKERKERKELREKEAKEKELREKEAKEKELREKEIKERELREKQEKEKHDSLLAYTNPLIDYDVSYFKDDVEVTPKEDFQVQVACDPKHTNPFVLMPREELFIKEQWTKQFGEEMEIHESFGHHQEKLSLTSPTPLLYTLIDLHHYAYDSFVYNSNYASVLHEHSERIGEICVRPKTMVHYLNSHSQIGIHSSYVMFDKSLLESFVKVNGTMRNLNSINLCIHLHIEPCLGLLTYDIFMIIVFDGDLVMVFDPGGWFHEFVNNKSLSLLKFQACLVLGLY